MYYGKRKKIVAVVLGAALLIAGLAMPKAKTVKAGGNKTFTVLSINVAGLPALLSSSNPSVYTGQMSAKLNNYDIVNTQEDFAYHNDLVSELTLPYRTDFSGNVPFGDGMDTFSRFPIYEDVRAKWNDAHGFITDGADEMTPKGILFTSIEIEPGYIVDVYNIHTDADCDDASLAARRSNMNQLAAMINTRSQGHAVIVAGDTNSRYTREGDNFETAVLDACGLTDTWIELVRHGDVPEDGDAIMDHDNPNSAYNEVVDKIWYRSGRNVELQAVEYNLLVTEFTDADGNLLSDHYPITATFAYEINETVKTSDTFGGGGGTYFTFLEEMDGQLPRSISIRTGNRVDSVTFNYPHGSARVGGNGGSEKIFVLNDGEYLTSVTLCKAKKSLFGTYRISYISFTTNFGRTVSGGTWSENNSYTYTAPEGYAIAGLQGFAGDEIDRLGCIYLLVE
ncbi:MAG: endonuclease/exonuclease/phosphatase family protein [Lachnospiraceae bacterium]|nr:endonuclease/exonuclease/phosphatase family protein [Lachnospiraceae bacterium]